MTLQLIEKLHAFLWNTKVYCRVDKNPPLGNISHVRAVLVWVRFNIILPFPPFVCQLFCKMNINYYFSAFTAVVLSDSKFLSTNQLFNFINFFSCVDVD